MRAMMLKAIDNYHTKFSWWVTGWLMKWAVLILAFIAWTLVVYRAGGVQAEKRYEAWKERFVNDYISQQEAAERQYPPTPKELLLNSESEALARVLYGVKDNSTDDLKTYCWCVLNRVDNDMYPDTVEEVISQPKQWMQYSDDNPVLENLYQIAREQLEAWHDGTRRPISDDFVYMNWTPTQITLRNKWEDGSTTGYWRYGK